MQHNADRGVLLPRRMIAALNAPARPGENDFRHGLNLNLLSGACESRAL
jgi:hypothetical protein